MGFESATLIIRLNEEGEIKEVFEVNVKDKAFELDPALKVELAYEDCEKHKLIHAQLRSTGSQCCWRKVNGRWKCRSRYCN
jgi:hypothetical protein